MKTLSYIASINKQSFLFSNFNLVNKRTFHFLLFTYNLKSVLISSFLLFNLNVISAQQLGTLIKEALLNSPEIQKFELQYSIASEKINEVHTMPNTEFGVGYFVSEPET